MFFIYVLLCADKTIYVGFTANLKSRFKEHKKGYVKSTENKLPIKLIYYEACKDKETSLKREKYLKTAWGKRYLKQRLKNII